MKKQTLAILLFFVALAMLACALLLDNRIPKAVGGVLIGVGGGLGSAAVSLLVQARQRAKHPELSRLMDIEVNDERNRMIRWRAQAMAGNITQWLVMALAFVNILINGPLWLTLVITAVYMCYTIIWMVMAARYQKRM